MEADWEFEISADAPVIDGAWAGYIDLQVHPECAAQLPEAAGLPSLAHALTVLNGSGSPVRTSKCDVWQAGEVDPYELDAQPQQSLYALACYIDLLPANGPVWSTLDDIADWCRRICARLRSSALRQCRVDLVIRRAVPDAKQTALGVSAYVTGCGETRAQCVAFISAALEEFSSTVRMTEPPGISAQKLQ